MLIRAFWRKRNLDDPALKAFIPLLAAAAVLFAAARFQSGQSEAQSFFTRVTPLMEKLQRMRAPYVWISAWWKDWLPHYLLVCTLALGGTMRVWRRMTPELRFFQVGLPIVGMLSMPLSWLLLEQWKWALTPQIQPMRALLFVASAAIFAAACAGCVAAAGGSYLEACAWFAAAYVLPVNSSVTAWQHWRHAAVIALLAVLACVAVRLGRSAMAVAALSAFLLIPWIGGVVNYPALHKPELKDLSDWARGSTPKDAVFLFPNFGKDLSPGIFRAEALRAVYVDWKGGGQVNYLKELGEQWWSRWQDANRPLTAADYAKLGIDYLVVRRDLWELSTDPIQCFKTHSSWYIISKGDAYPLPARDAAA